MSQKLLLEKRKRLEKILSGVKEGYILEIGCGRGVKNIYLIAVNIFDRPFKADGIEFLTKYKAEGKEWEEEMRETHFFFTEEDFEKFFNKVGFIVKSKGKYTMFVKKQINF